MITGEAVAQWEYNTKRRITEVTKGALWSISKVQICINRIKRGNERITLCIEGFKVLGSEGEPIFGNPTPCQKKSEVASLMRSDGLINVVNNGSHTHIKSKTASHHSSGSDSDEPSHSQPDNRLSSQVALTQICPPAKHRTTREVKRDVEKKKTNQPKPLDLDHRIFNLIALNPHLNGNAAGEVKFSALNEPAPNQLKNSGKGKGASKSSNGEPIMLREVQANARNTTPAPISPAKLDKAQDELQRPPTAEEIRKTGLGSTDEGLSKEPSVTKAEETSKAGSFVQDRRPWSCSRLTRKIANIPKEQQSLLESEDSWIPPNPRKRMPQAYVPPKLLIYFNEGFPQHALPKVADDEEITKAQQDHARVKATALTTVRESTESNDSEAPEDDLFPWSPTPRSPTGKDLLPPDSSAQSSPKQVALRETYPIDSDESEMDEEDTEPQEDQSIGSVDLAMPSSSEQNFIEEPRSNDPATPASKVQTPSQSRQSVSSANSAVKPRLTNQASLTPTPDSGKRPALKWRDMIARAILRSEERSLTRNEIYDWLKANSKFFREARPDLKETLSSNLTKDDWFLRGGNKTWKVKPEVEQQLLAQYGLTKSERSEFLSSPQSKQRLDRDVTESLALEKLPTSQDGLPSGQPPAVGPAKHFPVQRISEQHISQEAERQLDHTSITSATNLAPKSSVQDTFDDVETKSGMAGEQRGFHSKKNDEESIPSKDLEGNEDDLQQIPPTQANGDGQCYEAEGYRSDIVREDLSHATNDQKRHSSQSKQMSSQPGAVLDSSGSANTSSSVQVHRTPYPPGNIQKKRPSNSFVSSSNPLIPGTFPQQENRSEAPSDVKIRQTNRGEQGIPSTAPTSTALKLAQDIDMIHSQRKQYIVTHDESVRVDGLTSDIGEGGAQMPPPKSSPLLKMAISREEAARIPNEELPLMQNSAKRPAEEVGVEVLIKTKRHKRRKRAVEPKAQDRWEVDRAQFYKDRAKRTVAANLGSPTSHGTGSQRKADSEQIDSTDDMVEVATPISINQVGIRGVTGQCENEQPDPQQNHKSKQDTASFKQRASADQIEPEQRGMEAAGLSSPLLSQNQTLRTSGPSTTAPHSPDEMNVDEPVRQKAARTSDPITAPSAQQNAFLSKAKSGTDQSTPPMSDLQSLYMRFKEAYPEYNETLNRFRTSCSQVFNTPYDTYWDDYVVKHTTYYSYIRECEKQGEDPEPFIDLYQSHYDAEPQHNKHVLNLLTLKKALGASPSLFLTRPDGRGSLSRSTSAVSFPSFDGQQRLSFNGFRHRNMIPPLSESTVSTTDDTFAGRQRRLDKGKTRTCPLKALTRTISEPPQKIQAVTSPAPPKLPTPRDSHRSHRQELKRTNEARQIAKSKSGDLAHTRDRRTASARPTANLVVHGAAKEVIDLSEDDNLPIGAKHDQNPRSHASTQHKQSSQSVVADWLASSADVDHSSPYVKLESPVVKPEQRQRSPSVTITTTNEAASAKKPALTSTDAKKRLSAMEKRAKVKAQERKVKAVKENQKAKPRVAKDWATSYNDPDTPFTQFSKKWFNMKIHDGRVGTITKEGGVEPHERKVNPFDWKF